MSRISEDNYQNNEYNSNSNFNEYKVGLKELERSGLTAGYECNLKI